MNIGHSLKFIWEGFTRDNKPELNIQRQAMFREVGHQKGKFTERNIKNKEKRRKWDQHYMSQSKDSGQLEIEHVWM